MATRVPPAWVIRPMLATRNGIAKLHRGMVAAQVTVFERSLGIVDTKALSVAAELGVADALADGPRTVDELSTTFGVDADALDRLLRYLVGRGVFRRKRAGTYANNAGVRAAADRPHGVDATLGPLLRLPVARPHLERARERGAHR